MAWTLRMKLTAIQIRAAQGITTILFEDVTESEHAKIREALIRHRCSASPGARAPALAPAM